VTITWPEAIVLIFIIMMALILIAEPSRKRHEIRMAEIKAKDGEQYKAIAEEYKKLADETRETQATMQADLAAVRTSVEAIEAMMRDVG
jgi:hypothetical protein